MYSFIGLIFFSRELFYIPGFKSISFHCFLLPRKHLKISKMSSRCLQGMPWKTSWRCLQHNKFLSLKKSSRRLTNLSSSCVGRKEIVMLNTSSRQILKTSSRQAFKTSSRYVLQLSSRRLGHQGRNIYLF